MNVCTAKYLLITFPAKQNFLSIFHAFVNVNFQNFGFVLYFLAFTSLAAISLVDHLACKINSTLAKENYNFQWLFTFSITG